MSSWHSRRLVLDPDLLRMARSRLGLSQTAFAEEINTALKSSGQDSRCTKRLVQKWESGEHDLPVPRYQKVLEQVTGRPFELLCLARPVGVDTPALRTLRELDEIATDLGLLMQRLDKVAGDMARSAS